MLFVFFLLFIALCSMISWQIVIVGAVVGALVYLFARRYLGYRFSRDLRILRKLPGIVWYIVVLLYEIAIANFTLIRMILSPGFRPRPVLVTFEVPLHSDYARTMLANAITLTPGTITVALQGDRYMVHCLDESLAQGIEDSKFIHMLKKLEA
ncbi:MAG: sodium:proton antiporter [Ruminococcaceae bacterium]|nr:sodium:proton antiporter [Oscillospiraceae bacterium]